MEDQVKKSEYQLSIEQWIQQVNDSLQPVDSQGRVWVLSIISDGIEVPQAAFSNREYADLLAATFYDDIAPRMMDRDQVSLPVDRYVPFISRAKFPHQITIENDGTLFEVTSPRDGISKLADPCVSKQQADAPQGGELAGVDNKATLSGTFWGWEKQEAIQQAMQVFHAFKANGQLG